MKTMLLMLTLTAGQLPPQAPPVKYASQAPPIISEQKVKYDDIYNRALQESVKTRKPVVAFVGMVEESLPGMIVCGLPEGWLKGCPQHCFVVGVPGATEVHWKATLPADASVDDIRKALLPPVIVRQPVYAPPPMFFGGGGGFGGGFGGGRGGGGGSC